MTTTSQGTQKAPVDSFFVLNECRDLFVRRLADIARLCGITSPRTLSAMTRELSEAHDELAASTVQEGFEQTHGLTASRISLVGHDDLELDIRIGDIANQLRDDERIDHWRAQLRYMSLLHRPQMTPDNNPVGLETVRRGLWAICRESDGNLDQQFERLARMEEMLKLKLPDIYMEVNQLLESQGVQPAPTQLIRQGGSMHAPGTSDAHIASGGRSGTPANPLATLQHTMQQQQGGDLQFSPGFSSTGNASGASGNFAIDASTMVMLNHLIERLNAIELQQVSAALPLHASTTTEDRPPRPLNSKDLDLAPGKPAAIVLDTLALIFEAIFASPDLPDVVKSLLGRLQIPLLKQAILDPEFFANTQHPARLLVNRMARAALGLPQDVARDHPLCSRLARIADAIRVTLENNNGDLVPHLTELDALISGRNEAIRDAAQPFIQQVVEHEKRETALARSEEWLKQILNRTAEPAFVHFLSVHWVRVMQDACLEGGTTGETWKDGETVADHLLWSIQPKQTAEERKKLTTIIPLLIRKINTGLDRIAVPLQERKSFLDACFTLQTAALRGQPAGAPPPRQNVSPSPLPATGTATLPPVRILERNGKLVQYLGLPARSASPWRSGKTSVKPGDWLEFRLPDGKQLCGQCSWQDTDSRTMLLFNPDWGYAVALAQQFVEPQLQTGNTRIVSETSLFDAAAEQALGRLKGN